MFFERWKYGRFFSFSLVALQDRQRKMLIILCRKEQPSFRRRHPQKNERPPYQVPHAGSVFVCPLFFCFFVSLFQGFLVGDGPQTQKPPLARQLLKRQHTFFLLFGTRKTHSFGSRSCRHGRENTHNFCEFRWTLSTVHGYDGRKTKWWAQQTTDGSIPSPLCW